MPGYLGNDPAGSATKIARQTYTTGAVVTGVVTATTFDGNVTGNVTGDITGGTIVGSALSISGIGTINTTLHVGVGGTVLQASEDGTIAHGS